MKKILNPQRSDWDSLVVRPTEKADEAVRAAVVEIFEKVQKEGDAALVELAAKYDGVELGELALPKEVLRSAEEELPVGLRQAIEVARKNIELFHSAQRREVLSVETTPGITCSRRAVPIERVGLYIPGGTAPLFSTLLMLAVPAKLAGCREIVLVSPPEIHSTIQAVASMLGIEEVYQVGGAQAVAALACGTKTLKPVSKIFGPGNQYVTAAKQYSAYEFGVAIDMPAGPSEVLVIADSECNPRYVAADLLSQAEHGADSQVVLVAFEESVVDAVLEEVKVQLEKLPRRDVAESALENSSALVLNSIEEALQFSNLYAPEHLILSVKNADQYREQVTNAGSVFLGYLTPESFGDYASGTNHTLPTGGAARAYSGVSLESFQKTITFQSATPEGFEALADTVITMAEAEGLEAHSQAVKVRRS